MTFRSVRKGIGAIVLPTLLATTALSGQSTPTSQQGTVFRTTTNAVQTSVIVRDKDGRFVPDLKQDELHVYEDGVLQTITTFSPWIGGRSMGNLAAAAVSSAPKIEGLVLPNSRPKNDSSGRLFIVFIDDLHLQASDTPRVKDVLKKVRDILVHDNDLVGFVSTGTSSIEIDPAYDFGHRRFDEAIEKVMGSAPTVSDLIEGWQTEGAEGPQQVRYSAHVAFRTAFDMIDQLANVPDRRKAFVYVSSGYHFNPLSESRLKKMQDYYAQLDPSGNTSSMPEGSTGSDANDPDVLRNEDYKRRTTFSNADLVSEVAQLGRAAQRANVAFYTVDPRGLIATGADASQREQVSYADYRDLFQTQISTLRTLSEMTGGYALVESNDFEKGLRRIDAETSDFYMIGYTSSNPDPFKVRRIVKIEVTRPGLQDPIYRSEYTLPRPKRQ